MESRFDSENACLPQSNFADEHAVSDSNPLEYSGPYEQQTYSLYANGEIPDLFIEEDLFDFRKSQHSFVDSKLWRTLVLCLDKLCETGKRLKVLDIGFGDSVWDLRIMCHCRNKGVSLDVEGIDLCPNMVGKAVQNFNRYRVLYPEHDVRATFNEGDACERLPFPDQFFHLVVSTYTVLNHLPGKCLQFAIDEMLRVTKLTGLNLVTVRGAGGPETAYVCSRREVTDFCQKGDLASFKRNGKHVTVPSHLFLYDEIYRRFIGGAIVESLFGMDFVVSKTLNPDYRFAKKGLPRDELLMGWLIEEEEKHCQKRECIDASAHIVVVRRPKLAG